MGFLKPDLRKVSLFLLVLFVYVSFFFLFAPWVSSISTTMPILEFVGMLVWIFILITSIPFAAVGAGFRALGIDFFYSPGIIASVGIIIAVFLTIVWWYLLACTTVFIYVKFRRMTHISASRASISTFT